MNAWLFAFVGSVHCFNVFVKVNLGNNAIQTISDHFVGHAMDASLILKPEWKKLNFSDKTLRAYVKGISPTYIRFGGTYSDYTTFKENPNQRFMSSRGARKFKKYRSRKPAIITGKDIDKLMTFVNETNSRLLYCLNSHQRAADNTWDKTNSLELIDYTIRKGYQNQIDFGIGNEPLARDNISGKYIAKAIRVLRKQLDKRQMQKSKIIAPDMSRLSQWGLNFLKDTIQMSGDALSAASFHQYYMDSRNAIWENFVNPKYLDTVAYKIGDAKKIVKNSKYPDKPIWITEAGSSYGGGAEGLSRGYAAAMGFADKLGCSSSLKIPHVIRQSLFGGKYRLLETMNNYDPSAEFWINYLFRKFAGNLVKNVKTQPIIKTLRCYAFERRLPSTRSITLMILNVHFNTTYNVRFAQQKLQAAQRKDYIIRANGHPSNATEISVNGKVLKLENFILPEPKPKIRKGGDQLRLRPLEMAFAIFDLTSADDHTDLAYEIDDTTNSESLFGIE